MDAASSSDNVGRHLEICWPDHHGRGLERVAGPLPVVPLDTVELIRILLLWVVLSIQVGRTTCVEPPASCEHLGTLADAFVIVRILCAKITSWLADATDFARSACESCKVNPVVGLLAGQVEVLVQRVRLAAFPVLQLDLQHVAMPTGQLGDKLVAQPILSQRAPEAL